MFHTAARDRPTNPDGCFAEVLNAAHVGLPAVVASVSRSAANASRACASGVVSLRASRLVVMLLAIRSGRRDSVSCHGSVTAVSWNEVPSGIGPS